MQYQQSYFLHQLAIVLQAKNFTRLNGIKWPGCSRASSRLGMSPWGGGTIDYHSLETGLNI
jgi:hypothetical protein